uniref:Transmembrane protein n=1 Tax=Neospora caninum (strain Liverpool) TaxID=572307 RepID=A0A0F7ULT1_NEOCL|nr:TPA: hypothetical protein BN1204_051705 [Neospora caninum Liverpool]
MLQSRASPTKWPGGEPQGWLTKTLAYGMNHTGTRFLVYKQHFFFSEHASSFLCQKIVAMPQLFLADLFIFQCGIILLVLGSIALFVFLFPHTLPLGHEQKQKDGACGPRKTLDGPGDRLMADILVAKDFQKNNGSHMKGSGHGSVRRVSSRWHCIGHGHRPKKPPWQFHDSTASDAGWIQTVPLSPNRTQTSRESLDVGVTSLVEQPSARWRYNADTKKPQNLYDEMSRGTSRRRAWKERDRYAGRHHTR